MLGAAATVRAVQGRRANFNVALWDPPTAVSQDSGGCGAEAAVAAAAAATVEQCRKTDRDLFSGGFFQRYLSYFSESFSWSKSSGTAVERPATASSSSGGGNVGEKLKRKAAT